MLGSAGEGDQVAEANNAALRVAKLAANGTDKKVGAVPIPVLAPCGRHTTVRRVTVHEHAHAPHARVRVRVRVLTMIDMTVSVTA